MFPEASRFPDWMWKNRPFHDLVEWMRKRASSDGPYVFGMDCYCKEEAKEEVLSFFDFYDREGLGKEFRRSLYPTEQPEQWLGTGDHSCRGILAAFGLSKVPATAP